MITATKSSRPTAPRVSFLAATRAIPLDDDAYFFYLLDRIWQGRTSIWCTLFIVDVQPSMGGRPAAEIIGALAHATWLGLDVRVIVGGSAQAADIDRADQVSLAYLRELGVRARRARPVRRSSLHSKYVIVDHKEVIVGSHNWADFDLFGSRQTSIALHSPHLAGRLSRRFEELWASSEEVGK